jgi:hypothetical protein
MSDHPLYNQFRELSWRRKLTPAEEAELAAWLRAHPELQAQWESEVGLSDALNRLPDVPVASNFTARVLAATMVPDTRSSGVQTRRRLQFWHSLLAWRPRLVSATLAVLAACAFFEYSRYSHREELAKSVKTVSEVASLPEPVLADFDAIQRLSSSPPPDEELLKLLQ